MLKKLFKNSFIFATLFFFITLITPILIFLGFKLFNILLSKDISEAIGFGVFLGAITGFAYRYAYSYREIPPRIFRLKVVLIYGIYSVLFYFIFYFLTIFVKPIPEGLQTFSRIFSINFIFMGAMFLIYGFLIYWSLGYFAKTYLKSKSKPDINLVDYFKKNLSLGVSEDSLKEQAQSKNYSKEVILDSLYETKKAINYKGKEPKWTLFLLIGLFLFVLIVGSLVQIYSSDYISGLGQEIQETRGIPEAIDFSNYTLETKILENTVYPHKITFSIPRDWEEKFEYSEEFGTSSYSYIGPFKTYFFITKEPFLSFPTEYDFESYINNIEESIEQGGQKIINKEKTIISESPAYNIDTALTNEEGVKVRQEVYIILKDNQVYLFSFGSLEDFYSDTSKIFEEILKTIEISTR